MTMTPTEDSGPRLIRYADTRKVVWGDPAVGYLADWFYVRNEKLQVNIFGMPPGGRAGHSADANAIFGADEAFYLLQGEMLLGNPQTGELHRVVAGETSFFRKDTWNNIFNVGTGSVLGLEFFHPSSAVGTGSAYARSQPPLQGPAKYGRDELIGQWPMKMAQAREEATMWVIREQDYLWRLEGEASRLQVGIIASTEHATVGKLYLQPGQRTEDRVHPGEALVFLEHGTMHVELAESGEWYELTPWDGFHLPEGVPHRFWNPTSEKVSAVFAVGPDYLPS